MQIVSYIKVQVDSAMKNHLISYSFCNHSLYTLESELHKSKSRNTSLISSPIILSLLQTVSYIEV